MPFELSARRSTCAPALVRRNPDCSRTVIVLLDPSEISPNDSERFVTNIPPDEWYAPPAGVVRSVVGP